MRTRGWVAVFCLCTLAKVGLGELEFSAPRLTHLEPPAYLAGIESFRLVWDARDQGYADAATGIGTPEDIAGKWELWLKEEGADTAVHEGTHLIQAQWREKHFQSGKRGQPLFIPGRGFVLLPHPPLVRHDIQPLIPENLRGSRYKVYVDVDASDHFNALYLWDEWNAYLNGTDVAIEQYEKDRLQDADRGPRDHLTSPPQFAIYCLATVLKAKGLLPSDPYRQLREAYLLEFNRTVAQLRRARSLNERLGYREALAYWEIFLSDSSTETQALRAFFADKTAASSLAELRRLVER